MTDTFTKRQRSYIMSRVKGANTTPELMFRKSLYSKGLRYRLHYNIPGKPDIALASRKVAIFIDGCFWHKCPKCFRAPKSNKRYWEAKIKGNLKRASAINKKLKLAGWRVIRIWEHEVTKDVQKCINRVLRAKDR